VSGGALFGAVIAAAACNSGASSSSSTCDHIFDSIYNSPCGTTVAPDQAEHAKARYAQLCQEALALPNTGSTASWADACATAILAAGCRSQGLPQACQTPPGTLATGATCANNSQCQSLSCTSNPGPGGDGGMACGTCSAGVSCGTTICTANQTCQNGGCSTTTYVDAGGMCAMGNEQCNPGLYCDPMSLVCTALVASGGACAGSDQCQWPLVCVTAPMGNSSTCQTGAASGAACGGPGGAQCAPTLTCDQTMHCSGIAFAQAGQPCGGSGLALCEVGQCINGKCPTMIADGQACPMAGATCDWFAECTNGTCQLPSVNTCH
jgi:hypothetical protein